MQALCCCLPRTPPEKSNPPDPPILLPNLSSGQHDDTNDTPQLCEPVIPPPLQFNSQEEFPSVSPSSYTQVSLNTERVLSGGNDSDSEDENNSTYAKRTHGALEAVKTKIIRHMSQDSGSRRISIGHSEGEIARRVELKRIMHRRIQDELKSEEGQEESSDISHMSHRYLAPLIDLPGGGPRDGLEFSFTDTNPATESEKSENATAECQTSDNHVPITLSERLEIARRRSSCPEAVQRVGKCLPGLRHINLSDRVSLPNMAPLGSLSSARPLNVRDSTSIRSWRGSYNPSHLERVLGSDNNILANRDSQQEQEGLSALGTWLIAQGLRSRDQSFTQSPSLSVTGDPIRAVKHRISLDGLDGSAVELPAEAHIQDLSAFYDLKLTDPDRSRPQESPTPKLPCLNTAHGYHDRVYADTGKRAATHNPSMGAETDCLLSETHLEAPSSKYPSVSDSAEPSSAGSNLNTFQFSLDEETIKTLQLAPVQWLGDIALTTQFAQSDGPSSYKTAVETDSDRSADVSSAESPDGAFQTTAEVASLIISETSSYRDREAELKSVENRFANVLSLRKPHLRAISRFKEEFDERYHGDNRTSILSKLHITAPKRSKASSSRESLEPVSISLTRGSCKDPRRVPSREIKHLEMSSAIGKMSVNRKSASVDRDTQIEFENTAKFWQRPVQPEEMRRDSTINKQKTSDIIKSTSLILRKWRGGTRRSRLITLELQTAQSISMTRPGVQRFASQPKTVSDTAVSTVGKRVIRKPWNKPPSETGTVCTDSTAVAELAEHHGLALESKQLSSNDPGVKQITHPRTLSRSISGKFGRVVRSGLDRFHRTTSFLEGNTGNASSTAVNSPDSSERETMATSDGHQKLLILNQPHKRENGASGGSDRSRESVFFHRDLPLRLPKKDEGESARDASHERDRHLTPLPTTPQNDNGPCRQSTATSSSEFFVTPMSSASAGARSLKAHSTIGEESGKSGNSTIVIRRAKSTTERDTGKPQVIIRSEKLGTLIRRAHSPKRPDQRTEISKASERGTTP